MRILLVWSEIFIACFRSRQKRPARRGQDSGFRVQEEITPSGLLAFLNPEL